MPEAQTTPRSTTAALGLTVIQTPVPAATASWARMGRNPLTTRDRMIHPQVTITATSPYRSGGTITATTTHAAATCFHLIHPMSRATRSTRSAVAVARAKRMANAAAPVATV